MKHLPNGRAWWAWRRGFPKTEYPRPDRRRFDHHHQACQSFRRLVAPMTGILEIKKSAPSKKHKQTVSSDASLTQQTPSKSSICALYLATLIQKIGLLSVRYGTNRRVTLSLRRGSPRFSSLASTVTIEKGGRAMMKSRNR